MIDPELKNGEHLVQEWTPQFRIFLHKMYFVGFVTAVILGGVSWSYGVLWWMLTLPLVMAAYVFVFDDYVEWHQRRNDRWLLTNKRLIFINPNEEAEPVAVDLGQIIRMKQWMWWAMRVKMTNGQTIMMMFLPDLDTVRTTILSTRDQTTGASDG